MKTKILLIFIFIGSMHFVLDGTSLYVLEKPLEVHKPELTIGQSYTPHNPINIDGDTQLNQTVQNEGWSGSGIEGDPYIIENYFITERVTVSGVYEVSLSIQNVHQHLMITNNLLSSSIKYNGWGIFISESSNITVMNNQIDDYSYAIFILNSLDITIQKNIFTENYSSTFVSDSEDIKFEENSFLNSSTKSFYIVACDNIIFQSNLIKNSNIADSFGESNYMDVISSLIFYNNTFSNSYYMGCILSRISDSQITYNKFLYNDGWDLLLYTATSANITRNQFINDDTTTYSGNLQMSGCTTNTIYENNFISNSSNAVHIYQDNLGNLFYNNNRGNYYSKYTGVDANGDGIGDTPYNIVTDVDDVYPLIDPVDFVDPVVTSHDTELTYDVKEDMNISWVASDENPTDYRVYQDGELVKSGTWLNGTTTVNISNLTVGTYVYTVELADKDSNSVSFSITVIVIDSQTDLVDFVTDNVVEIAVVGGVGAGSLFVLKKVFWRKKKK